MRTSEKQRRNYHGYGIVYAITNKTTKKIYIGQTIHSLHLRWSKHVYRAPFDKYGHLQRAILKYGKDDFIQEVLAVTHSQEHLDAVEKYYIYLFDTMNEDIGYNTRLVNSVPPELRKKMGEKCGKSKHWSYDHSINNSQIIDLYKHGFNMAEIAKMFERSLTLIKTRLTHENVLIKRSPLKIQNLPTEEIIHKYLNGYNLSMLSRDYKTSVDSIKHRLLRSGIVLKTKIPGNRSDKSKWFEKEISDEEIVSLRAKNFSFSDISKYFDVSLGTVKRRIWKIESNIIC